jgi:diaminohydroxyphosphoribosylaminopyrimidine deaminase/5-amino-6-(5-phosphoribosylamino)uracil reductase
MRPADEDDRAARRWMEQALALGALGEGATSPNPRVGCVLVRDGRPVGRGFHQTLGAAHAEAQAVAEAGPAARGATAFVSLEPCAHQGRTPPCAELLIGAGVRRVVAAVQDPNPRVDGRGFARLEQAGVEVEVGLCAEASRGLNEAFFHRHRCGRPLVTAKAAVSLDGVIAARGGRSRWITGEPARRFAHRQRLRHDAILVGAGTVRRDDPRLTVRLPGVDAHRLRVVLAPAFDLDPGAALFRADGPVRVYGAEGADAERERVLAGVAQVVRVPAAGGRLSLAAVLADLAALEVQSVLVEGGAKTFGGFLEEGLVDRLVVFLAGRLLGARGATPLVDAATAGDPSLGWPLEDIRQLAVGEDIVLTGRLRRRPEPAPPQPRAVPPRPQGS